MIITNETFPYKEEEIVLSKLSIDYSQILDGCQSSTEYLDNCQILNITTDDAGAGKFYRIKTGEAGWSFSDVNEIVDVINDFIERLS